MPRTSFRVGSQVESAELKLSRCGLIAIVGQPACGTNCLGDYRDSIPLA